MNNSVNWDNCIPMSIWDIDKIEQFRNRMFDKNTSSHRYKKPNWDLKQDIYNNFAELISFNKIIKFDKTIILNIINSTDFDIDINEETDFFLLSFVYPNNETKQFKGRFWVDLYFTLRDDFIKKFKVDFTKDNIKRCFPASISGQYNNFDIFIKSFSSDYSNLETYIDLLLEHNAIEIDKNNLISELDKICNSLLKKRKRIINKVFNLLQKPCIFLTFTFNDSCLNRTTENTRRQKIRRILTDLNTHYLGNIDYGSINEREHYHVLVQIDRINADEINKKYHKYGCVNFEKVYSPNEKSIGNYINKLSNHSLKKTKVRTRLIYDRI